MAEIIEFKSKKTVEAISDLTNIIRDHAFRMYSKSEYQTRVEQATVFTDAIAKSITEAICLNHNLLMGLHISDIATLIGAGIGKHLAGTIIDVASSSEDLNQQIYYCETASEAIAHGCKNYIDSYVSSLERK